jgi:hypothetical protein
MAESGRRNDTKGTKREPVIKQGLSGASIAPEGVSHNSELFGDTVRFWQKRAGRKLGDEDAREIVQNVAGFFDLLASWDAAAGETVPSEPGGTPGTNLAKPEAERPGLPERASPILDSAPARYQWEKET